MGSSLIIPQFCRTSGSQAKSLKNRKSLWLKPVPCKSSNRYYGTTPITFEKNWVNEETITESTAKTVENASKFNVGGSITVGAEAKAGAIFAKAKMSLNVSVSWGGEWSKSISTADTLETAKTKAEGESESIAVTIGDHGEEAGTYR